MATAGKFPVKLYVYDLSRGLARSLSQSLIGRHIDGIWHTGIVVYNQEFFYGGTSGIESCPPVMEDTWMSQSQQCFAFESERFNKDEILNVANNCQNFWHVSGTILGNPDEVVDLGKTEIPQEVFMDYLHELSINSFRPECYHLFNFNCNTFSNEVSHFLVGRGIPSHITSLPQDVLNTPFGAVIQPFVDALHVQGGHTLFPVGSASHLQSESDSEDADDVQKDSVAGSSKNKKTTSMGSQSKKSKK